MSRTVKKLGRVIAALSTTLIVGGVATASYSAIELRSEKMSVASALIPASAQNWKDQSITNRAENSKVLPGAYLGQLSIPSIGKRVNYYQGTDGRTLKKGVGHFIESVMPGIVNNSVLSGHRDTVFSDLGKVKIGALIRVSTVKGEFLYKVNRIRIVKSNDRTVIVPTAYAQLTLSTCYPFRYIGNAPERYVVIARLVD